MLKWKLDVEKKYSKEHITYMRAALAEKITYSYVNMYATDRMMAGWNLLDANELSKVLLPVKLPSVIESSWDWMQMCIMKRCIKHFYLESKQCTDCKRLDVAINIILKLLRHDVPAHHQISEESTKWKNIKN